jgi:hypothetical protein
MDGSENHASGAERRANAMSVPSVISDDDLFGLVDEATIITGERERFHSEILTHVNPAS